MKSSISITRSLGLAFVLFQVSASPINFTAKSANVADAGTPVKVSILRWSTDQERKAVVDTLDPVARAAAAQAAAAGGGRGGAGGRGGGGRGGARGGRGGGGAGLDPDDPAQADVDATPARGRNRGNAEPAKPPDPIAELTTALSKAPTVGYLWTNETVGYSIKFAQRIPLPSGGERIILATDRPLGGGTAGWRPTLAGTPTNYAFTLIELRMDSKGVGEGKASLTSKVIFDSEAKTLMLDNYAGTPAILQSVSK